MGIGPVEKQIRDKISKEGTIWFALIDSEEAGPKKAAQTASKAQRCGVSAILVGGSTASDQFGLEAAVKKIKETAEIPVILFPGNVTGVCPSADAILFSSLLNSDNPYFITQAQALGALAINKYDLEAIPTGYLIVGEGGAAGFVGRARGIPPDRPGLAAMHALAAKYMGMRFLYLEAGSGAQLNVPVELTTTVRRAFDDVLVVGGGIRRPSDAERIATAGADVLVVGTLLEQRNFETTLTKMIQQVRQAKRRKKKGTKG